MFKLAFWQNPSEIFNLRKKAEDLARLQQFNFLSFLI